MNSKDSRATVREELTDRAERFAMNVRRYVLKLPYNICAKADGSQLVRSSGSVGANLIEANEAVSFKDKVHRVKICKKEAKESIFWLKQLAVCTPKQLESNRVLLQKEAQELLLILSTIVRKYDNQELRK